jgi:pimeloyl-ACP methyl ester carboxylesterase
MVEPATLRVELGDGEATTVERWGERGPALIAVHGLTSSRKSWQRVAERLAADYRVFAYDQRGHGDSAGVAGPMTLERSAHDLAAVAAAIGEVYGLIGHSWGGAVVVLAGRRLPVARVIAVDPVVRIEAGRWSPWLDDIVGDLDPIFAAGPAERPAIIGEIYAALPPVDRAAKVHAMRHMSRDAVVRVGEENDADAGGWDLRETLRAYPRPLLIALADPSDSVVLPADVAFLHECAGANVRVELFTGESHSLHRTALERFCVLAKQFLAPE